MKIVLRVFVILLFSFMLFNNDTEKQWVVYAWYIVIAANVVFLYFDIKKLTEKNKLEKQP